MVDNQTEKVLWSTRTLSPVAEQLIRSCPDGSQFLDTSDADVELQVVQIFEKAPLMAPSRSEAQPKTYYGVRRGQAVIALMSGTKSVELACRLRYSLWRDAEYAAGRSVSVPNPLDEAEARLQQLLGNSAAAQVAAIGIAEKCEALFDRWLCAVEEVSRSWHARHNGALANPCPGILERWRNVDLELNVAVEKLIADVMSGVFAPNREYLDYRGMLLDRQHLCANHIVYCKLINLISQTDR